MSPHRCLRSARASPWARRGDMRGAMPIGVEETWILTSIAILTRTATSIAASTKVETEDKAAGSSIIQSTARVFHIVTKGHRKNSTARAAMTRSNRASSFVDEPSKADKILAAEISAIAAVKVGSGTAEEPEIAP